MNDLSQSRLRANPKFRLLQLDQLEEAEKKVFGRLADAPNIYGILAPAPGSKLPTKSVSNDAALLFLALREPARAPTLLASLFGPDADARLLQYIIDGVFEVEHEGAFVSGAAALALFGGSAPPRAPTSRVARLSVAAIEYAAALEGLGVAEVAARLYMFNRSPCTPALQRLLADDTEVIARLTATESSTRSLLASRWEHEAPRGAWMMWRSAGLEWRPRFKLYVSPVLDDLPETFAATVDTLARVGCRAFKLGRGAFGILRPDKLVAYFESIERIHEAAERLSTRVAGRSGQGVPFTAAIDAEGLLSWGMDPPRLEQVMAWQEDQSWRQWVVERVAVYTLAAKRDAAEDVARFTLQRLAMDGVDPESWSPNLSIWRGHADPEDDRS